MKILIIAESEDLIPSYATEKSSGADLKANIKEEISLPFKEAILIPTGVFLEIPEGFEAQIRPRSGIALRNSVTVLNTPGTIDADYRGEVKVILINHGKDPFIIKPKMRIAQIVFSPIQKVVFIQKEFLETSKRGASGFGHSGVN